LTGGKFVNGAATAAFRIAITAAASESETGGSVTVSETEERTDAQEEQPTSGPGKWVTVDVDKRGVRNLFQIIAKRTETMGDEGRVWGSDGKDFEGTVQDVTQEWQALSTSEVENLRANGFISVDRTFGETRVIKQIFLEGPDPWQQSGKSWYWQPTLRNQEFELQQLP